jgi:murein L,D-transpeptidase YafK
MICLRMRPVLLLLPLALAAGLGSAPTAGDTASRPAAARADRIVVDKSAHLLRLWHGGQVFKTYHVALGRAGLAPKARQGDDLVPEGQYRIDSRNAQSAYHLALHISYPNPADLARARKQGVPPGGDIMIHGLPNRFGWLGPAHRLHDWTRGCIAVTNEEIEEIWRLVPTGTPVEIRP